MDHDDASSMISSPKLMMNNNIAAAAETSDSNDTIYANIHQNKRARLDANAESSFGKFKGVVPQQNGHWGAQIYANHQRIWLGTFKSETTAAMAYDSAAIKLRSGDTHRNFPWTSLTLQEPYFQNHYSTEAILNMIKDGSYPSKFADFVMRTQSKSKQIDISVNKVKVHGDTQYMCKQLFQKELTPSDVGKLNRLVIPKKYAVKYFPYICENLDENMVLDDIELVFYDKLMRTWKFRYCYWRSSQSFVFTRGWNRFVKEKNLKANDVVTFYTCESNNDHTGDKKAGQAFCLIDVSHNHSNINNVGDDHRDHNIHESNKCFEEEDEEEEEEVENHVGLMLGHKFGGNSCIKFDSKAAAGDLQCKYKEAAAVQVSNEEDKGFRLFGVRIN